jgi:hypothetical protein
MHEVFAARCPRRAESENQSGVQPRTAREALRVPPEVICEFLTTGESSCLRGE